MLDCKIKMGILRRKCIITILILWINRTFLILKDKMAASDYNFFIIYIGRNSMCHDIFYFRMHLFM